MDIRKGARIQPVCWKSLPPSSTSAPPAPLAYSPHVRHAAPYIQGLSSWEKKIPGEPWNRLESQPEMITLPATTSSSTHGLIGSPLASNCMPHGRVQERRLEGKAQCPTGSALSSTQYCNIPRGKSSVRCCLGRTLSHTLRDALQRTSGEVVGCSSCAFRLP